MRTLCTIPIFLLTWTSVCGQKIEWSTEVEGSVFGSGVPASLKPGYAAHAAAVKAEDEKGERPDPGRESPATLHYQFLPLRCQQVIIVENFNPGAVTSVEVGKEGKGEIRQEVYSAKAKVLAEKNRTLNIVFPVTDFEVSDVWISVDYKKVPGINQIAGVALCDSKEPYTPKINLPSFEPFDGEPKNINEDIKGNVSPSVPRVTADGRNIYFNHDDGTEGIFFAQLRADGTCQKVEYSIFNLPQSTSSATGLVAIQPDNNAAVVSDLSIRKPTFYYLYFDKKDRMKKKEVVVRGYSTNAEATQNEIMSADGNTFITDQWRGGALSAFREDLYVAHRLPNGDFSELIRMGDVINTGGNETPCFLSPDNVTLYFSSNGHLGYGGYDVYATRRLDDTWTRWSEPINLGPKINSEQNERYFTIIASGNYAYFTKGRTADEKDLYRIMLAKPKQDQPIVTTVRPQPVVLVHGRVLDINSRQSLEAEITYENLSTGKTVGYARSNASTGEYTITLPVGVNYAVRAAAAAYITISENMDATHLDDYEELERDLLMAPIEIGQVVRVNNIFFETGKADLKFESNVELDKLVSFLQVNPSLIIEISGHTDNVGDAGYNLALSGDRAKAVVGYLMSHGIAARQISARGFGETKPLASNDSDEGRQLNRRVEFVILKK